MGLLGDSFDDPQTMATLALAGSLMGGRTFGQGLLGGVQGYQSMMTGAQDMKLKKQISDAQLANYQSEIQARNLATIRDQRQQEEFSRFFGSGGGSTAPAQPGQIGSGSFGIVPLQPGMNAMPQSAGQGGLGGKSLDDVARFSMMTGKDLLPAWKIAQEGFKRDPGSFVDIPGKPREFIPDVKTGLDYRNGVVSAMPGFSEAQAGIEGAKAGAVAQAQGRNKTMKVYNPATQREEYKTEADVVAASQPQAQPQGNPAPTAARTGNPLFDAIVQTESNGDPNAVSPKGAQGSMQVMPTTNTNPGFGITPAKDNSDGERTRVGQEYFTKMREKYNGNDALAAIAYNWGPGNTDMWLKSGGDFKKLPAETQSYVSQVLTRNGVNSQPQAAQPAGSGGYAAGPSTPEKLSAEAGGKINETWLKTSYEPVKVAGDAANDMLTNVQVARQSMRAMPGGTGWGAESKATGTAILTSLGIATKNAELYASNAQTFQSASMSNLQTVLNAAKGPQTEGDADRAGKTFAQLKNTPQANEFILDLSEAKAQRDQVKAQFYEQALPIARGKGDLQEIDREWRKRAPSVFSMPTMQKWGAK